MPPLAVIVAAALDLVLGDPPNRLHPVAWMGRAIAGGRRALCRGGRAQLFVGGALGTLAVAAVAAAAGGGGGAPAAPPGGAGGAPPGGPPPPPPLAARAPPPARAAGGGRGGGGGAAAG